MTKADLPESDTSVAQLSCVSSSVAVAVERRKRAMLTWCKAAENRARAVQPWMRTARMKCPYPSGLPVYFRRERKMERDEIVLRVGPPDQQFRKS